jgi:DNA-binding transcriptional regulator YiaG
LGASAPMWPTASPSAGPRLPCWTRVARHRHVPGELRLDELLQQDAPPLPQSQRHQPGGTRRADDGAGRWMLAAPGRRARLRSRGSSPRWIGSRVGAMPARAARLSPRLVQSLRRRLGLSQMALARLMGVSAPAVAHWEVGESMPTGRNRVTLVALRKVRKREVKELLARRVKETASRAAHFRKRRPKRPGRRAAHRRGDVSRR